MTTIQGRMLRRRAGAWMYRFRLLCDKRRWEAFLRDGFVEGAPQPFSPSHPEGVKELGMMERDLRSPTFMREYRRYA